MSGWSYPSWDETYYPEGRARRRQLEHIGRVFDSVEVNGSFYSLLSPTTYRSWYRQTPDDFVFAVKGSRFITHNKKLSGVESALANFFASGVLALEEKLGPILWQLPRTLRFERGRLESFLALLPRSMSQAARLARGHDQRVDDPLTRARSTRRLRHALEARHESFFTDEAVRVLRDAGVALVASDSGGWPRFEEVTAGFVYVRLHGRPRTYVSRYSAAALDAEAEKVRAWLGGHDPAGARKITGRAPPRRGSFDVYVYFDNTDRGHAPVDALRLRRRLEEPGRSRRASVRASRPASGAGRPSPRRAAAGARDP